MWFVTPQYKNQAQHSSILWLQQLALHGFKQITIIMSHTKETTTTFTKITCKNVLTKYEVQHS